MSNNFLTIGDVFKAIFRDDKNIQKMTNDGWIDLDKKDAIATINNRLYWNTHNNLETNANLYNPHIRIKPDAVRLYGTLTDTSVSVSFQRLKLYSHTDYIDVLDGKIISSGKISTADTNIPKEDNVKIYQLNRKHLIGLLQKHIMKITFIKVNGEKRTMLCTLQDTFIKRDEVTFNSNENIINVWDIEVDDWRSFRINSIINAEVVVKYHHW